MACLSSVLFFLRKEPGTCYSYSRGQAKPANKNGNLLMREKLTGKRVDALKEASGQNSPKSHEPLSRKCPYTEMVPENLAYPQKVAGKI